MLARFRPSLRLLRPLAYRKCPRHRKSCVIVGRAASDSPSANSAGSVSHYELRFPVRKSEADAVSDELLETSAALSVTLEDANAGTDAEQEIFAGGGSRRRDRDGQSEAWGSRERWADTLLVAHFLDERDAAEALASAEVVLGAGIEHEIVAVKSQDWVGQVLDSYEAIEIDAKLWVVPSTLDRPPDPEATNVALTPGVAFGNGGHPTTKLCLRWLASAVNGGEVVCDYGAGTGVLGIASCLLGASRALCTDIEETAVRISEQNAVLNGVADRVESVLVAEDGVEAIPGAAQYDIIVANILQGPLVSLRPIFVSSLKKGGVLAMSGCLATQADEVVAEYAEDLTDLHIEILGEWALITGTKG